MKLKNKIGICMFVLMCLVLAGNVFAVECVDTLAHGVKCTKDSKVYVVVKPEGKPTLFLGCGANCQGTTPKYTYTSLAINTATGKPNIATGAGISKLYADDAAKLYSYYSANTAPAANTNEAKKYSSFKTLFDKAQLATVQTVTQTNAQTSGSTAAAATPSGTTLAAASGAGITTQTQTSTTGNEAATIVQPGSRTGVLITDTNYNTNSIKDGEIVKFQSYNPTTKKIDLTKSKAVFKIGNDVYGCGPNCMGDGSVATIDAYVEKFKKYLNNDVSSMDKKTKDAFAALVANKITNTKMSEFLKIGKAFVVPPAAAVQTTQAEQPATQPVTGPFTDGTTASVKTKTDTRDYSVGEIVNLMSAADIGNIQVKQGADINNDIGNAVASKVSVFCSTNSNSYYCTATGKKLLAQSLKAKMMNDLSSPAHAFTLAQYAIKNGKNNQASNALNNIIQNVEGVKVGAVQNTVEMNGQPYLRVLCEKDGKQVAAGCLVGKDGKMYSLVMDLSGGGKNSLVPLTALKLPQQKQPKINMEFKGGSQQMCYNKNEKKKGWQTCNGCDAESKNKGNCIDTTFDFSGAGSILFGEQYEQIQAQIKEFENKYIPLKPEFWSDKMCSQFDQLPNGASIAFITDSSGQIYPAAHIEAEKTDYFDFLIEGESTASQVGDICTSNPELCAGAGANSATGNSVTGAVVLVNQITGLVVDASTYTITQLDFNNDGRISQDDSIVFNQFITNGSTCEEIKVSLNNAQLLCDFNEAGNLTIGDVLALSNIIDQKLAALTTTNTTVTQNTITQTVPINYGGADNAASNTGSQSLSKIITKYDVDLSGKVDTTDKQIVEGAVAGTMPCGNTCDFNVDGKTDGDDLNSITNIIETRDANADGAIDSTDVALLKTAEDLQAASEGAITYQNVDTGEEGAQVTIVRKKAYKVTWFIKNVKKMPGDEATISYRVVLKGPEGEFRSISKPVDEGESDGRSVTGPLILNNEKEFTQVCLVIEKGYSRFQGLSGNELCNSIIDTSTKESTIGTALATAGESPYGASATEPAAKQEGDFNI